MKVNDGIRQMCDGTQMTMSFVEICPGPVDVNKWKKDV
jgi:hypothetical protein